MRTGVHRWLDRHAAAGDVTIAVALFAVSVSTLDNRHGGADMSVLHVGLSALLVAPLVWRRRAPVATFAAVMVACAVEVAVADTLLAATSAALVALYTLVAAAPRRLALAGLAVALAGTVPFGLRFEDQSTSSWGVLALLLALQLGLAAALGDRARARRLEREMLVQRARLLAAARDDQAAIAAAAERTRIARELHDVVAHSLSVVIAQADGGRYAAARDPQRAAAALQTIADTAREAQGEMRHALGVLRDGDPDPPTRPQPGVGDLGALVARTRDAGLDVALVEQGAARELPAAAAMALFRVAQEGLTNVLKHAGRSASARVTLRWEPRRVVLAVRDDGAGDGGPDGHRGPSGRGGRGLAGMRERVEPRGGTVTAGPRPGGGFEVRAELPLDGGAR